MLALVGVPQSATAVVLTSANRGRFEDEPAIIQFARALPLAKALHPDTLLAWEMNGKPLPSGPRRSPPGNRAGLVRDETQ